MFAKRSWDGLWREILSSDTRSSDPLQLTEDEAGDADCRNTEDDIESWAALNLPPLVPVQTVTENSLQDTRAHLCYGMVSRNLIRFLSGRIKRPFTGHNP